MRAFSLPRHGGAVVALSTTLQTRSDNHRTIRGSRQLGGTEVVFQAGGSFARPLDRRRRQEELVVNAPLMASLSKLAPNQSYTRAW
jgi:hypothetical protein